MQLRRVFGKGRVTAVVKVAGVIIAFFAYTPRANVLPKRLSYEEYCRRDRW
jgi:hypothetical protein